MKRILMTLAAAVALTAFADRVTLKSGTVLTGKVLGTEGDVIKFQSDDFGALDVKKDSIQGLVDAAAKPVEVATVAPVPKPPETWHGSVNVALSAERGNSFGDTASIVGNLKRRWESDRVNFDLGYHYAKSGKHESTASKSEDRIEAEGQWDHFWSKKVYDYLNVRYDRDKIQELDRRVRLGGGLGYQWLEKEDLGAAGAWSFSQEAGVAYVNEEYEEKNPDRDENYASFRYAHHLEWLPKYPANVSFFHNLEYLPDFSDFAVYLMKSDVGFKTMLFWNINLLAKIEWDYNSKPSEDRKKSDTRYFLGLGYAW